MDSGNALYNRICAQGYEERQDDVLAIAGMAEDIQAALLDYQVGDDKTHATAATKIGTV